MLTAEVIRYIYNSQKRFISCDDCGITYSHSDYNVLLDHQKI